MSLFPMISFAAHVPPKPVDIGKSIPEEFDIFYRSIEAFIPEGKTLADLTPEELKLARNRYRFDPMKPGIYQTITGFQNMI